MKDDKIIDEIIEYFKLLAKIPRKSGHEKDVSDYLKGWAEERKLTVKQNKANDLIIDVPATVGLEKLPLVALQGHMDMVCVAKEGKKFDFLHDPIKPVIDFKTGTMKADGTTLGADDGIGIAIIMGIMDGKMAHGPIRGIFTTNEEVGMDGALALKKEDLDGVKYLINIDSEESDTVVISSAADAILSVTAKPKMKKSQNKHALKITLAGLHGGHSGTDIEKNYCNANIAMAEILKNLRTRAKYELVYMRGGSADNAICQKAEALIQVKKKDVDRVRRYIEKQKKFITESYKEKGSKIELYTSRQTVSKKVLSKDITKNVIKYIRKCVNGVHTMSEEMDGLVESSSNLGIMSIDEKGIEIRHQSRSSAPEKLTEIVDKQKKLAKQCKLSLEKERGSKAWPINPDSKLVRKICKVYHDQNDQKMKALAIHAGLECGVFADLKKDLDIVSIGPDVIGAHSPYETLMIDSIPKIWNLLEGVLKTLD